MLSAAISSVLLSFFFNLLALLMLIFYLANGFLSCIITFLEKIMAIYSLRCIFLAYTAVKMITFPSYYTHHQGHGSEGRP